MTLVRTFGAVLCLAIAVAVGWEMGFSGAERLYTTKLQPQKHSPPLIVRRR